MENHESDEKPVALGSELNDGLGVDEIFLYKDTVVQRDGDFAIVESTRIFGTGWNVYKAVGPGGDDFEKINERGSYFTSIEAAEKWLSNYRGASA